MAVFIPLKNQALRLVISAWLVVPQTSGDGVADPKMLQVEEDEHRTEAPNQIRGFRDVRGRIDDLDNRAQAVEAPTLSR